MADLGGGGAEVREKAMSMSKADWEEQLRTDIRKQHAWAFQITDAHGVKQLLVWLCFPKMWQPWANLPDDETVSPVPTVQLFRFKREAMAARKYCMFKDARIVKVNLTIEVA